MKTAFKSVYPFVGKFIGRRAIFKSIKIANIWILAIVLLMSRVWTLDINSTMYIRDGAMEVFKRHEINYGSTNFGTLYWNELRDCACSRIEWGNMPALWQSSQRPMYVKTVWVDGLRHAILSYDDPYFLKTQTRPRSSASNKSNQKDRDIKTNDSNKFDFVIKNNKTFENRPSSCGENIEKLNLTDFDQDSDEKFVLKVTPQPLNEFDSSRTKYDSLNMRTLKSQRTARSDVKENTELSERVLQWLDLAGKVHLLAPEPNDRMSQPRHSWPEIQRRNYNITKSKTAGDVSRNGNKASPKVDSAKAQSRTIDRDVIYVSAANTIENYARQTRNEKLNTRNETAKTKDKQHKTKDNENKTIAKMDVDILETRQQVESARDEVHKQYAELISKKLIPNVKNNKRQVHIFMPALPKRVVSNSTSRAESLLSQLSHFTHKSK